MPKTRILHCYKVYAPDVFGGIPYVIEQLMSVEKSSLEQSLLVCSRHPKGAEGVNPKIRRVKSYGTLFSLPIAPSYPLRLWRSLRETDIVILHAPFPLADLILAFGSLSKAKLIIFWHSDIVKQRLLGLLLRPLLIATLKRAQSIVVSSRALVESSWMLSNFHDKIDILPFSVSLERFALVRDEVEKVRKLRRQYPKMILSIGRLVSYKGFDVLVCAASSFKYPVCIIGEGPEYSNLAKLIREKQLSDRVFLLGKLLEEDVKCFLNAAEVFVLPSVTKAETFGIVQLEAMAAGNAIVNTQLPTGVPELARNGIEAITVKPGSVDELSLAIHNLMKNNKLRRSMQKAGRLRAANFSFSNFKTKYLELVGCVN